MTGDGTQANPYTVASAADFAELGGKSGYVIMTADIDFASLGNAIFDGVTTGGEMHFDGQGHTINNFYQELSPEHPDGGLFQGTYSGSIRNLNVTNAYVLNVSNTVAHRAAVLIARSVHNAVFENVTITGVVETFQTESDIAGVVPIIPSDAGALDISFENCKVVCNFVGGERAAGYITGYSLGSGGSLSFKGCISACRFMNQRDVTGGFIGTGSNSGADLSFVRCVSQIKISDSPDRATTAHIYGLGATTVNTRATAASCAVICDVDMSDSGNKVEFHGLMRNPNGVLVQCYVKGSVKGASTVYGAGNFSSTAGQVIQCYTAIEAVDCGTVYGLCESEEAIYQSFYDSQLMPDSAVTVGAATTAQLKSPEWLREQGWAI